MPLGINDLLKEWIAGEGRDRYTLLQKLQLSSCLAWIESNESFNLLLMSFKPPALVVLIYFSECVLKFKLWSMEPLIACTKGKISAYPIYLFCMHAAISCTLSKSKHISLCIINAWGCAEILPKFCPN